MIIKLYSQNALDGFSRPETAKEYIEIIRQMKPDVAVFTEAYKAETEAVITPSIKQLESMNYFVFHGLCDEQDGRKDKHGSLVAMRTPLASAKEPRLRRIGGRNILECWLKSKNSQDIHLLGIHLNDRSEAKRQAELDDLLQLIDIDTPTILAGDMNTIHKREAKGTTFRRAKRIHLLVRLKLHPKTDPTGQPMPNNRGRTGSVLYRLHEMASGKAIKRLEESGFIDTDPDHQPTFPANSPYAQLDHILISSHFTVKNFNRLPQGGSDHRGIVVDLEI